MALDMVTLFRVSAMLYLLMALIIWALLGRPRRGPAMLWCLGGMLVGVSAGLLNLRGTIPDFWSYSVGQTLYLGAMLVLSQSLRMTLKKPWRWRWLLLVLIAFAAVISFGFDDKRDQRLAIVIRLANSAGLFALTASALLLARRERSRNAWFMAIGYGLMCVSMVVATVAAFRGQANLADFNASVFNHLLVIVSLLTMVTTNMGYLGLALEKSLRKNMALRQQQWHAQQWRERRQALTLLDRQHTLDVLANSLGHAILQPLTATLLQVQLAKRMLQTATPDVQQVQTSLAEVVQGLRRSADWVAHIRNFLRPAPAAEPASTVTMQSVVQDAHDLLRQELMYQGVTLLVTVPPDPMEVQAERLPLTQALVQVLRNAMQAVHKQAQRTIHLTLSGSDTEVWMEVTDTGPGFTLEMLDSEQAIALPASEALYGMGLAMTRNILAQFRGRLTLDNNQHGGARVRMTLPAQAIQGCAKINLTAAS